jgi:HK97 family phage prohead protease
VGKHISTKQFRESYKPGEELPKDLVVCSAAPFSIHKEEGDNEGLIKTFTISTPAVDREGDRLLANWELQNFNKGGSVLWGHDSRRTPDHVVAAPLATWQEGEALKSRAKFTPREINPTGFMVYQLIKFGALRSSSVGFMPKEWKVIDDEGRYGYDFEKLELLERSVVPVPANPEALVDAKAHGIDIDPMVAWTEEVLDKGVDLIGVERDLLEASWKAVKAPAVVVPGEKQRKVTSRRMPDDPAEQTPEPKQKKTPSIELTIDTTEATKTIKKLAEMVGQLDEKVAILTERLETEPKAQPAPVPDEVEIDLSDPEVAKVIREEIGDVVDTTLRKLRGQLPD